MGHFVDEMRLALDLHPSEIIAIGFAAGMEVEVPPGRHRDASWLERKPLAAADRDFFVVDRVAEDCAGENNLAGCQWPLAANRTAGGERYFF
ncbi:hypothetical protein [Altererythrobacter xiamenensis]|uniref:hypothetical protein n=1 Tax=Altererythrobacter xiamenensis TaxID=1316679 RepID=UPI0038992C3C